MKIVSVEPTPSPNAMKLNMDESVSTMRTYDKNNREWAPEYIQKLLAIEGVKSVFQTADFISIDRYPNADWRAILSEVREAFGEGVDASAAQQAEASDGFGEVDVFVQVFRNIPMQIRVRTKFEEVRESLPARFEQTAMEAGLASPNLIRERKLINWGVRYGEMKQIAEEVIQEIDASYDDRRLELLKEKARQAGEGEEVEIVFDELSAAEVMAKLDDDDWRVRYAALDRLNPSEEHIDVLEKALDDDNASVRRLAVVYLGEIGGKQVLQPLFKALQDSSASVRRTAGDSLSDLGDPEAIGPMIPLLKDKNKIVRWRAARFLYETGDETALEALHEAKDDPEFEVSLQVNIAIERIESGEEAAGTIWQQMTRARS